jgi:hypothetical protein
MVSAASMEYSVISVYLGTDESGNPAGAARYVNELTIGEQFPCIDIASNICNHRFF